MLKKAIAVTSTLVCVLLIFVYHEDIMGFLSLRPRPDFEISSDPKSVTINGWEGSSNRTIITVKSIGGFSGNVTFEIIPIYVIGDLRFTLDSPSVILPAGGETQCQLTFYVASAVPPEKYYIEVVGTSGDLKHSVRIMITVLF